MPLPNFSGRLLACAAVVAATTGCGGTRSSTPLYYSAAPPQAPAPAPAPASASPARAPVQGLFGVFSALAVALPVAIAPFAVVPGAPVAPATAVACPRFEVAPGVWFAPDCGDSAKVPFSSSSSVPFRRSLEGTTLPASVDLRASGLDGPVKDQEQVGICFAFALSTVIENGLRRAGRQEVVAPLHVLSSDAWDNLWSGRKTKALTTEPSWPYDPAKACKLNESRSEVWCEREYGVDAGSWRGDPQLVAEVARADRVGFVRALRAEKLERPLDPDQVARILATGQSMVASLALDPSAWGHKGKAGPEIPDWTPRPDSKHAVVLVGYRTGQSGRQFLLHNSWSTRWRDGGYAWISEEMLRRHTKDAFTVEIDAKGIGAPEMSLPPIPKLPPNAQIPPMFGLPAIRIPAIAALPALPFPTPQR